MVINSYSKINLSLSVNNKLKDGLHEIQSYFCLKNLSDKIQIRKSKKKKDKILFKGPFARHIKINNNSVSNLLKLFRFLIWESILKRMPGEELADGVRVDSV